MRHLPTRDIPSVLRRGKSVEQFLGQSPGIAGSIRHVELRPTAGDVELWVFDVQDIGAEDFVDIYDFHCSELDGPRESAGKFGDADAALATAERILGANPDRWTNLGVGQDEYLDFVRAGRPLNWPVAAADSHR
ncbi:hypothetical protein CDL60_17950 [Roseateles noduli]|nr:hypothetical protein CDL60_17950 [Roseateles noduli]